MCKTVKDYLSVIRDYKDVIIMFVGTAAAVFLYLDFKAVVQEQAKTSAHTAEVLRTIDQRLQHLENYHEEQLRRETYAGDK